jgi:hypothetical protein
MMSAWCLEARQTEVKGQAKSYQVRQFLKLVERYNLKLGDEA